MFGGKPNAGACAVKAGQVVGRGRVVRVPSHHTAAIGAKVQRELWAASNAAPARYTGARQARQQVQNGSRWRAGRGSYVILAHRIRIPIRKSPAAISAAISSSIVRRGVQLVLVADVLPPATPPLASTSNNIVPVVPVVEVIVIQVVRRVLPGLGVGGGAGGKLLSVFRSCQSAASMAHS